MATGGEWLCRCRREADGDGGRCNAPRDVPQTRDGAALRERILRFARFEPHSFAQRRCVRSLERDRIRLGTRIPRSHRQRSGIGPSSSANCVHMFDTRGRLGGIRAIGAARMSFGSTPL